MVEHDIRLGIHLTTRDTEYTMSPINMASWAAGFITSYFVCAPYYWEDTLYLWFNLLVKAGAVPTINIDKMNIRHFLFNLELLIWQKFNISTKSNTIYMYNTSDVNKMRSTPDFL